MVPSSHHQLYTQHSLTSVKIKRRGKLTGTYIFLAVPPIQIQTSSSTFQIIALHDAATSRIEI